MSSTFELIPALDDLQFGNCELIDEFYEFICNQQLSEARQHRDAARHFLIWLQINDIDLETVDGAIIGRFLQHQCDCHIVASAPKQLRIWKPRSSDPKLIRFIRFLEQTGYISTPGDLQDNVALVHQFMAQLRAQRYPSKRIALYRAAVFNLIVWLHFFRIPLCELTSQVLVRYRQRRFMCSIPELFCAQSPRFSIHHNYPLMRFIDSLLEDGRLKMFHSTAAKPALPEVLQQFAQWLKHCRGARQATVDIYISQIAAMLPTIGEDPSRYDAAMIDEASRQQLQDCSASHAKKCVQALRMQWHSLTKINCVEERESSRLLKSWHKKGLKEILRQLLTNTPQ